MIHMTDVKIVPSYPAPSFTALKNWIQTLAAVTDEVQIDFVDGRFVSATSWPFTDAEPPLQALEHWEEFPTAVSYECDLMVQDPEQYLDALVQRGVKRVIIHHQSTRDYEACVAHAQLHGYIHGLAVLPHVVVDDIAPLLEQFSYVQVMGIASVGAQGQPFASAALQVIAELRVRFPNMVIGVDGAVNADTIPSLVAAGATRLAPGSAITKAANPAAAFSQLQALAERAHQQSIG